MIVLPQYTVEDRCFAFEKVVLYVLLSNPTEDMAKLQDYIMRFKPMTIFEREPVSDSDSDDSDQPFVRQEKPQPPESGPQKVSVRYEIYKESPNHPKWFACTVDLENVVSSLTNVYNIFSEEGKTTVVSIAMSFVKPVHHQKNHYMRRYIQDDKEISPRQFRFVMDLPKMIDLFPHEEL